MIKRVRYWDLAGTETGCYTVGLRMSVKDGIYYIEDVVRGKWTPHERDAIILQTAKHDAQVFGSKHAVSIYVEQEPGSSGVAVIKYLTRLLAGFSIRADRPSGNKDLRLEPFAAQCEARNVVLIEGSWNSEYIEEMTSIPNGQYRDQGDASSGAFNILTAGSTSAAVSRISGLPGRAPIQRNGPR